MPTLVGTVPSKFTIRADRAQMQMQQYGNRERETARCIGEGFGDKKRQFYDRKSGATLVDASSTCTGLSVSPFLPAASPECCWDVR